MLKISPNKTLIMGILNITPDSFSDGGKYLNPQKALKQALKMIEEGADIIDIGAESSRPGSLPILAEEELKRILPVLKSLKNKISIPISIDTYKPKVAEVCLQNGAKIINNITGGNEEMFKIIAKYNASVVIMHMQGTPENMQKNIKYNNLILEIKNFLRKKIKLAKNSGVKKIIIDPGIGFGKTLEHNLLILKNLAKFKTLGYPILVGASRKSFIGKISGAELNKRLPGSLAALAVSILNGANIIRAHDVSESKQAAMIVDKIKNL